MIDICLPKEYSSEDVASPVRTWDTRDHLNGYVSGRPLTIIEFIRQMAYFMGNQASRIILDTFYRYIISHLCNNCNFHYYLRYACIKCNQGPPAHKELLEPINKTQRAQERWLLGGSLERKSYYFYMSNFYSSPSLWNSWTLVHWSQVLEFYIYKNTKWM